jgi:hypothetical protein
MGMRPSTRRSGFTYDDPIGEYQLSNGRTIQVVWLAINQTHDNIVAWEIGANPAPMKTVDNVVRVQCAPATEKLLEEFESL